MKKLGLLFVICFSGVVFAADLPVADKAAVKTIKKQCKDTAMSEGLQKGKKQKFILECVNASLTKQGFQNITKLKQ